MSLTKVMYEIHYLHHSDSPKKPDPVPKQMGWFFEFDAQKHFMTLSHNPKVSNIQVVKRVTTYEEFTEQFSSNYIKTVEECYLNDTE